VMLYYVNLIYSLENDSADKTTEKRNTDDKHKAIIKRIFTKNMREIYNTYSHNSMEVVDMFAWHDLVAGRVAAAHPHEPVAPEAQARHQLLCWYDNWADATGAASAAQTVAGTGVVAPSSPPTVAELVGAQ